MDCLNNIIQLIPGIFISDSRVKGCESKFENFNIKYLINFNNTLDSKSVITFNLSIDTNYDFYNSSSFANIDLDKTNDFIISALQNNSNILICDENLNMPLLIAGAFLIRYLNMTLTETIYWITKKSNISEISKNICYQLFLYFQKYDLV